MTKLPFSLLLLASSLACAQRLTPQFGVLTDEEKSMTAYQLESTAPAVILFDIGDSYFFDTQDGYDIRFTRMKRTKIFTRAGIEQATVTIPYYIESVNKQEKVASIEAYTYVLKDGLVYKKQLDPSTVYEEQINNRWRVKKFVFPDVQDGSIIEYKYVLETPFHFNLPDWTFQSKIPTRYSEYTVSMIPFYEYIFLAQGITKFDYQNSAVSKKQRTWGHVSDALGGPATQAGFHFTDMVHTYAMKNIPSFADESYVTSVEDYIMKMDFQLAKFNRPTGGSEAVITTWPELNKRLLQHEFFGKYMSAAARLSKKILEKELVLSADLSEEKKCESIVEYVRSRFRWDEFHGYTASKSAKDFAEQRNGSMADINLFLTAMLRSAGLNAEPVILSTRSHGKIRADYPYGHYFNAVVVFVSGQRSFLVDGTDNLLAYDRIPIRCINEKGLVVSEQDVRWIGLEPRAASLEEITVNMKVDPENATIRVSGQISATEYEAYEYKTNFKNDSLAFKKYLFEKHQLEASQVNFFSYDNPRRPYVMMFAGQAPVEKIGNKIVLQPFLNFPLKENPFRQDSRTYPVDFIFPRSTTMKSVIQVPAGYKVESLPEPDATDNELGQIKLISSQNGENIEIQAGFILKKSTYSSNEYVRLKNLFTTAVRGLNKSIVLEKK